MLNQKDMTKYFKKCFETDEKILHYLAKEVLKKEEFEFNSHSISLKENFRKLSMIEAVKEHINVDFSQINNLEEALELAQKHNLKLAKFQKSIGQIILAFFEEYGNFNNKRG